MHRSDKTIVAILCAYALAFFLWASVAVGAICVAIHFIRKIW